MVKTERKERDNRERNVVLFGVPISTATSDEEREKEDEATTFEILAEIEIEKKDVEKIKRFKANPKRTAAAKSLPVRVTFKWEEDVLISLKKAKALKDSSKFKNVFFNKDLTALQIDRLKQLIKTRNTENVKLDANQTATKTKANYRYGIRNDMEVKVYVNKN